jgi:serine/threonine-protein kinase
MTDALARLKTALADRYSIERELGAGGMATVYLAHDVKHDRKVAVKVLRPELAAVLGADRFVQEIKTTANLQHPHILPLFDSGEADSFLYYVMPYVEGESLRERLDREKQLSVDESIEMTRAVASALDYAHRHDVIHRDIKPENILLHDGQPMVADFGIALAVSAAGGTRITETGLSLGTPHYMSPEQATADRDLDARSDVYSLACVSYEMLVGQPPHTGATVQAIIAKIITDEPAPIAAQRKSVPTHIDEALRTALAKLPADRFPTAGDLAKALADPGFQSRAPGSTTVVRERGIRRSDRVAAVAVGVAAVAVVVAGWALLRPLPPQPVHRVSVALPAGQEIVEPWLSSPIALSADGSTLAYVGPHDGPTWQIWVRRRDELNAAPVRGTFSAVDPVLSPDGSEVAFTTGNPGPLRVVQIDGAAGRTVADSAVWGSLDWGDDGAIYYRNPNRGVSRVSAAGGSPEVLTAPTSSGERPVSHLLVDVLPGARGAVFTSGSLVSPVRDIASVRFETGEIKVLVSGTQARYSASGHLLWTTPDRVLMAAPFDLERLELTGPSVAVLQDVYLDRFGSAHFDVSESGAMVYRTGTIGTDFEPVWVERDGTAHEIAAGWQVPGHIGSLGIALSPDGARLALSLGGVGGTDVWVRELPGGTPTRLTFDGPAARPSWTPDGHSVVYVADLGRDQSEVWQKAADGSSGEELVVADPRAIDEVIYSHDGAWVVYRLGSGAKRDLYAIQLGRDSIGQPLLTGDYEEKAPALSPNDRWLAYVSDESGREEVYVRPFPNVAETRWLVSTNGGTEPVWARSGEELFYRDAEGDLVSVAVSSDTTFSVGRQRALFSAAGYGADPNHVVYDVSPDDRRFVMLREAGINRGELIWVEHWFDELRERVGN